MALLLRFRARPSSTREVRLTVTPDSVPRRRSATLATDPFSTDKGSARGGPADTSWYTDQAPPVPSVPTRGSPAVADSPSIMIFASPGEPPGRDVASGPIHRTPVRSSVGVSVGRGADPVFAAIQTGTSDDRVPAGVPAGGAPKTVEATSIDRLRSVLADDSSRRRAAIDDRRTSAVAERRATTPSVGIAPAPTPVGRPAAGRPPPPRRPVGVHAPTGSGPVTRGSLTGSAVGSADGPRRAVRHGWRTRPTVDRRDRGGGTHRREAGRSAV